MRGLRFTPLLSGALVALLTGCGASSEEGVRAPLQSSLRVLARSAPAGDHAYWLGPAFERAPVAFADASWGRYAILTYRRRDIGIDIDVESFRAHAQGVADAFRVRTRTPTGQDVVLVFHSPARPDATLVRAARAALAPIPAGVTYP